MLCPSRSLGYSPQKTKMRDEKKFRLITHALRKLTPSPRSFVPPKKIALLLKEMSVWPNTGTGVSGRRTGNQRTFSKTSLVLCGGILRESKFRLMTCKIASRLVRPDPVAVPSKALLAACCCS